MTHFEKDNVSVWTFSALLQKRIHNLAKHLRCLAKHLAKNLHLRYLTGFWMHLCYSIALPNWNLSRSATLPFWKKLTWAASWFSSFLFVTGTQGKKHDGVTYVKLWDMSLHFFLWTSFVWTSLQILFFTYYSLTRRELFRFENIT